MFGKFKILPKQKHFFFATFFTLTAVLGYPLEIWSLKWVSDLSEKNSDKCQPSDLSDKTSIFQNQ